MSDDDTSPKSRSEGEESDPIPNLSEWIEAEKPRNTKAELLEELANLYREHEELRRSSRHLLSEIERVKSANARFVENEERLQKKIETAKESVESYRKQAREARERARRAELDRSAAIERYRNLYSEAKHLVTSFVGLPDERKPTQTLRDFAGYVIRIDEPEVEEIPF